MAQKEPAGVPHTSYVVIVVFFPGDVLTKAQAQWTGFLSYPLSQQHKHGDVPTFSRSWKKARDEHVTGTLGLLRVGHFSERSQSLSLEGAGLVLGPFYE